MSAPRPRAMVHRCANCKSQRQNFNFTRKREPKQPWDATVLFAHKSPAASELTVGWSVFSVLKLFRRRRCRLRHGAIELAWRLLRIRINEVDRTVSHHVGADGRPVHQ